MKTEVTLDSIPSALRSLQPGLSLLHVPISKSGARTQVARWAAATGCLWFDTEFRGITEDIGCDTSELFMFYASRTDDIVKYTEEGLKAGVPSIVIWPLNGCATASQDPALQLIAEIPKMALYLHRKLQSAKAVGLAAYYTREQISPGGVVIEGPYWHQALHIMKLVTPCP